LRGAETGVHGGVRTGAWEELDAWTSACGRQTNRSSCCGVIREQAWLGSLAVGAAGLRT